MTRSTSSVLFGSLVLLAVLLAGCEAKFHPADNVDADGDGFFAPGPGAVNGKFVCQLIFSEEGAGDDDDSASPDDSDGGAQYILVQAGDQSQVIEGDPAEVCLGAGDLDNLGIDCDDNNDDRFPNAAEICDGIDNDCNNELDATERDDDGDGYTECGFDPATRLVTISLDCNDDVTEVEGGFRLGQFQNPGLQEVCGMAPNPYLLGEENLARPQLGLDDDCDGLTYSSDDASNPGQEVDLDADGHADCELQILVAPNEDPSTRATIAPDCDDTNPGVNPSIGVEGTAGEGVAISCVSGSDFDSQCVPVGQSQNITKILWAPDADFDQDGAAEAPDADGDGYPDNYLALCSGENPVLGEWINTAIEGSLSDDCNDADARLETHDRDGDGFTTCDGDYYPGFISADDEISAFPGAVELCDGLDNDLDGDIDEDFDQDGDGAFAGPGCTGSPGAPYSAEEVDCDDTDPVQNQVDLDGDGDTPCGGDCNDTNPTLNAQDLDGDGATTCAGDCNDDPANNGLEFNLQDVDGDGFTTCDGDCDDSSNTAYPGAPISCDSSTDDDCDGVTDLNESDQDSDGATICGGDCDDNDPSLNADDSDGDGFTSCTGDCNDSAAAVYTGAPLECDSHDDNDCNGQVDPNELDLDNDGESICDGDCDDNDGFLNSLDADGDSYSTCDGDCDDGSSALNLDDADGDGWPTCPVGLVAGDCDDADTAMNPGDDDGDGNSTCGADGQANTVDDDCDDNDAAFNTNDVDGDGFSTCGADGTPDTSDDDCDDGDNSSFPGGSEFGGADGADNDCDGQADEGQVIPGALAITEIMIGAAPVTTDGYGEYIEVLNTANHPVDLRGWEVHVTDDLTFSTSTFQFDTFIDASGSMAIASGARAVLARSSNALGYGFEIADIYWEAAGFSDLGGEIELDYGGILIDSVVWGGSGCIAGCDPLATPATYSGPYYWRTGHAMSLNEASITSSPSSANDIATNWCEEDAALGANGDFGSPGAATSTNGECGS